MSFSLSVPEYIGLNVASVGVTAGCAVICGAPALAGVSMSLISSLFTSAVLACIKEPSPMTQTVVSWIGFGVGLGATIGIFAAIGVTVSVLSLVLTSLLAGVLTIALTTVYLCCRPASCGEPATQALTGNPSVQTKSYA